LICFLQLERVWELDTPRVVHPLGWFICLLGCGSLHLCSLFFPCLGVLWLIYSWQGFITQDAFLKCKWQGQSVTHPLLISLVLRHQSNNPWHTSITSTCNVFLFCKGILLH
jgi:hypothetical protein